MREYFNEILSLLLTPKTSNPGVKEEMPLT